MKAVPRVLTAFVACAGSAAVLAQNGPSHFLQDDLRDGPYSNTGRCVAIDTDGPIHCAIVASPNGSAVEIYERSDPTLAQPRWWKPVAQFVPSGAIDGVAIDGNTAVVGLTNSRVEIYQRVGSTWSAFQTLPLASACAGPAPFTSSAFGYSVAIDGDRLVVGSPYDTVGGVALAGGALVYTRPSSNANWSCAQYLSALAPGSGDRAGWSVDIDGPWIVLGAPQRTTAQGSAAGAAFVFDGPPMGPWMYRQELNNPTLGPTQGANTYFGWDVAVSGDWLAAGVPFQPVGGTVQLFDDVQVAGLWIWTKQVQPGTTLNGNDQYGTAVALDGDALAVGAPNADSFALNAGAVFVHDLTNTSWEAPVPEVAQTAAAFGISVDIGGDSVIGGAWNYGNGPSLPIGRAFTFVTRDPHVTDMCFGSGPAGGGPDCPCMNNTPVNMRQGCANSLQTNSMPTGGRLVGIGSSFAASDDLYLSAHNLPPSALTISFASLQANNLPFGQVFGDGLRLPVSPMQRLGARLSASDGTSVWSPPFAALYGWSAGTTVYFQTFYRNPSGPCGQLFNVTNALEVLYR